MYVALTPAQLEPVIIQEWFRPAVSIVLFHVTDTANGGCNELLTIQSVGVNLFVEPGAEYEYVCGYDATDAVGGYM